MPNENASSIALREFYSNINLSLAQGSSGHHGVFLSLMNTFSKTGLANYSSNESPYGEYGDRFLLENNEEFNTRDLTIDFYQSGGRIEEYMGLSISKDILAACGYYNEDLNPNEIFKRLPMQIRTLNEPIGDFTIDKWEEDPINPISNKSLSSYFNFKYSMINRVDVLVGFEQTTSPNGQGYPLVKSPIWEPLTKRSWSGGIKGSFFLCRMKPFDCPQIGIEQPKGLKLPVYDNYFILEPSSASSSSDTTGASLQVYANRVR